MTSNLVKVSEIFILGPVAWSFTSAEVKIFQLNAVFKFWNRLQGRAAMKLTQT